jgi:hypothetical protein
MRIIASFFMGLVFVTFAFCPTLGFSSPDIFSLNFDLSDISFDKVQGYDRVKMKDGRFYGEPGTPLLPARYVQIAIPNHLEVQRVDVISSKRQELSGSYQIYPTQPFYPISQLSTKEKEVEFIKPDTSVYVLPSEYPGRIANLTNNGFLGGQHIAGVALYPLQYIPAEGKLIFYTQIEFRLVFRPSSHFPLPVNRRSQSTVDFYSRLAKSIVINPEVVQLKGKGSGSKEEEIDYLIITDGDFVSIFQGLADWKIQKGISTEIKDLAWVLSNYDGYDDAEKIRNCIKDYYSNYNTKWVLLGGDTPVMPYRKVYVMYSNIPCDHYFSDLDGNWDADGNHIYGQYDDEVDMYPDVFVGRAPVNDLSEAQIFVDKCLVYETTPPTDYQNRILYAAEFLWPSTDAAECKDYIDNNFVPDHFEATRLYENLANLNRVTFAEGLNQGQNIINHNGHGNINVLSLGSELWFNSDMDDLINTPRYSLFYTFGCITAAIDEDCIGEHFINNPNGGGFAYCGNTRSGWGVPGSPLEGPGPEFDIEFFRCLFDSSQYQVGMTLGNSKIPFIPIASQPEGDGSYYWWTICTLLLLGDPSLELWTDIPAELMVSHASVFFAGASDFTLSVAQDSALVCCVKEEEILGTAYSSGGSATVEFGSPLITLGTMHVTVTKHDHMPYLDTVSILSPEAPFVIYHSHQIDDSQGNNNGVVNPGETIIISITVKNIGLEEAQNVSATLREDDDYVIVTDSLKAFGDVGPGMTAVSLADYVLQIDTSCPDSHIVKFDLEATNGETSWVTSFLQMVAEPDFVMTASSDTVLVPKGDSSFITLTLTPLGGFNWPVNLSHTELPAGVTGFLDPDQLVPQDSSVFRLYGEVDALPGIHPVTITATGNEITQEKELVLGIVPPPYHGPIWYISTSGHDMIGNGSQEFPFRTIQRGIESASDGDTVLVERGLYMENINFSGKAILVASHFILDGLEFTIASTVIDGGNSGSVVTFNSGEDSSSVIRGFTITGGYKNHGGGIRCYRSAPTVADNFLVENACAWGRGGAAIYCRLGSGVKIYRNLIANCSGPAAIFINDTSSAQVTNNTLCNNPGGGISTQHGSYAYIKDNIFFSNADYGIHMSSSSWDLSYNDVYGSDLNYWELPDQTGINGNISADPLFRDSSAGDYHLTVSSPCIDAGDPADSVPSGGGTRIDIGTFEFIYGPQVYYHSHQIDDSEGNNNGVVNPGEEIAIPVTVNNLGTETAYSLSGILRTDDDFVSVTDSIKEFSDLEPGTTAVSMGDYRFEVDSSISGPHQLTFELELTDDSSIWYSHFTEVVLDTEFVIAVVPPSIYLFPGDSGGIEIVVTSLGGFASQVNLTHSEPPPDVIYTFNPDHLIPSDTSILKIKVMPEASMGFYPITVTVSGGGITKQDTLKLSIVGRGDANQDGAINASDVIYLIAYLFRGGPPPYVMEAGDANSDGEVNAADIVYLIQYLFRGGPPPGDKAACALVHAKNATLSPACLWLSHTRSSHTTGNKQIMLKGSFGIDLAAIQLTMEYDAEGLTVTPVLPVQLQALSIFASQQGGVMKIGILDPKGESWIAQRSKVDLLVLEVKGADLSSLKIKQAILVDREACILPVKILAGEEREALRPESFSLSQNYPNPFNPQTQIKYALPYDCDVKVSIYNILGRRVRVLVDEHQSAGYRSVHWDGKDEQGDDVASGIYFYKIQAGDFQKTKKMVLLK